jgi:Protein of unknown function (DUF4058)
MLSPFPGMDPYLENPEIFPDFHDSMIFCLRESIQASLPSPYFAALGRRLWIEFSRRLIGQDVEIRHRQPRGPSSLGSDRTAGLAVVDRPTARPVVVKVAQDEVREPFIEIYVRNDEGKRLVTSVEVLSYSNKTPGAHGRDLYLRKQEEILASKVHLVEIDLLRDGEHATAVPHDLALETCGEFDYHVSVHNFADLEKFFVYPILLNERLPPVEIPLLPGDSPVTLDLQAAFDRCYGAGPYAQEIRYGEDAITPPLDADRAAWASQIVDSGRA